MLFRSPDRASISASTPYSAARSGSGPVSTVSPPLARACRAGNAEHMVWPRRPRTRIRYRCGGGSLGAPVTSSPSAGVTHRLAKAPSSGPAWEPFLMWRILTASLGAGRVSGHRTIGVIPGGDQRPGQQEVSVSGAGCVARLPGTAHVPFTVCSLHRRRRQDRMVRTMAPHRLRRDASRTSPAGGRIHAGLPRSHQRRRGLVKQWRVTQGTTVRSDHLEPPVVPNGQWRAVPVPVIAPVGGAARQQFSGSCRAGSSGPAEPGTGSCPGQPARLPRHRPPRRRPIAPLV